ncbi:MAG: site-specific integrase [Candidatus Hydrogenedentes bacterium]|nr:site-specific integrase [Candidatus Hydrogenedentota bacterium]
METPKRLPPLTLHKPTGQWYVRLNGACHYLGRDKKQAQSRHRIMVAQWLGRGCVPEPPPPEDLTVTELCALYVAHCREYYAKAPQNLERVRHAIAPLLALCGDMTAMEVGPPILKVLRQRMIDKGNTRTYINRTMQVLVRMYRWAVAEMLLPPEVHQRLKALEGLRQGFTEAADSTRRQPMTEGELEAVRGHLPKPVMAALEVMFLTGARPSEILNLRPMDIDKSGDVWRVDLEHHKTSHLGKSRHIFLGPRAQHVIAPYLLRRATAYLFSPREAFQESLDKRHEARVTPMSCGNRPGSNRAATPKRQPGDHYEHAAFRRCIARAIEQVNAERKAAKLDPLRNFCPYEARHGAATRIRQEGTLDMVQAVLGHAKIDMSAHYAQLNDALAEAVMKRMG